MYHNGSGLIKKDLKKAAYYYEQAVLKNHPEAMLYLGTLYYRGNGVN